MDDSEFALFTDLYELTMLQAYHEEGLRGKAVFDLFVRRLPKRRNFLLAGGLGEALDYLERLSFSPEALSYLGSLRIFSDNFLHSMASFRFTGTVRAMPEGTLVFPPEPILEVEAPLPEAQLVETFLLNQIVFQTMIASKGARAVLAARGRTLIDFGSRRAHGTDAALKAARALYLAGFASTSNVLAGQRYGIPVAGTMAHSYVEAHDSELEAFRAFARVYPETVLLVDTYDTATAVRLVARLGKELREAFRVRGVRLDSGDLGTLAKQARHILDEAGLERVQVIASGGLNERDIEELVVATAPITAFGVGTSVVVSDDAPSLDAAYKLVAYEGRGKMKLSAEKATLPGAKQVFRQRERDAPVGDLIALRDEALPGEPLLQEVMRNGRRTAAGRASLQDGRERARMEVARLPERLRTLAPARPAYSVGISARLREAERHLREELARRRA